MKELKKDQNPEFENSKKENDENQKSLDSFKDDAIEGDAVLGGVNSALAGNWDYNYEIIEGADGTVTYRQLLTQAERDAYGRKLDSRYAGHGFGGGDGGNGGGGG